MPVCSGSKSTTIACLGSTSVRSGSIAGVGLGVGCCGAATGAAGSDGEVRGAASLGVSGSSSQATIIGDNSSGSATRIMANRSGSQIRAAAKAGRVIPVADRVRGGPVAAAGPVDHRVDIKAAAKGALGIGGPLVEVAHHVEDPVLADAALVLAGRGQPGEPLVEARVIELRPDPLGRGLEVLDGRMTGPRVVAGARRGPVAERIGGRLRALTRAQPLDVAAQALARQLAGRRGALLADVALRDQPGRAHGPDGRGAGA